MSAEDKEKIKWLVNMSCTSHNYYSNPCALLVMISAAQRKGIACEINVLVHCVKFTATLRRESTDCLINQHVIILNRIKIGSSQKVQYWKQDNITNTFYLSGYMRFWKKPPLASE